MKKERALTAICAGAFSEQLGVELWQEGRPQAQRSRKPALEWLGRSGSYFCAALARSSVEGDAGRQRSTGRRAALTSSSLEMRVL